MSLFSNESPHSHSNNAGSGAVDEVLRNIRETPVSDENVVDIRRLLASGAPFNLLLSFGFDKLSTRSVFLKFPRKLNLSLQLNLEVQDFLTAID